MKSYRSRSRLQRVLTSFHHTTWFDSSMAVYPVLVWKGRFLQTHLNEWKELLDLYSKWMIDLNIASTWSVSTFNRSSIILSTGFRNTIPRQDCSILRRTELFQHARKTKSEILWYFNLKTVDSWLSIFGGFIASVIRLMWQLCFNILREWAFRWLSTLDWATLFLKSYLKLIPTRLGTAVINIRLVTPIAKGLC